MLLLYPNQTKFTQRGKIIFVVYLKWIPCNLTKYMLRFIN